MEKHITRDDIISQKVIWEHCVYITIHVYRSAVLVYLIMCEQIYVPIGFYIFFPRLVDRRNPFSKTLILPTLQRSAVKICYSVIANTTTVRVQLVHY